MASTLFGIFIGLHFRLPDLGVVNIAGEISQEQRKNVA